MSTSDRFASRALITGSLAGLATMALHPSGHDVVGTAAGGGINALNMGVHALALAGQALLLAGLLRFTQRLSARRELGVLAFVLFALASVAVLIAATASGFLASQTVRGIAEADAASRAAMMGAMSYTGMLNQAFARVHVILSGLAILAWSAAMFAVPGIPRALAGYGVVIGVALPAGVLSAMLRLDIHGFGLVVLTQGAWATWIAVRGFRALPEVSSGSRGHSDQP